MSAYTPKHRGATLRVDRRFGHVGRVALATGTTNPDLAAALDRMLTELWREGYHDVLRGIKARRWTLLQVYEARKKNRLAFLEDDIKLGVPLWEAIEASFNKGGRADSTIKRYRKSIKTLQGVGVLSDHAAVSDLADIDWAQLAKDWPNSATDYNLMRCMVTGFLTRHLGHVDHEFRRQVVEDFPRRHVPERVPDISRDLFWRIVDASDPIMRPTWITLVATGMRWESEYCRCQEHHLMPHTYQVMVPGTKTPGSEDIVRVGPETWKWVRAAIPCPVTPRTLQNRWYSARAAAGAPEARLHDLRHCLGQWLAEEGRSVPSVQATMRHASPAMTIRYMRQRDRGENAQILDDILFPDARESRARGA